ncbi:MAG: NUDIX hydrolase, partial [Gammaproteobacteria bacterium]|nr:NUDIX hydrolase [Gammaproteobacteria bacterium]
MSNLMRPRVCAAILREDKILMVRHEHNGRSYWTLPGGGVEPGERREQAVVREVLEETHLQAKVVRFLFDEPYSNGTTYCYLATVDGAEEIKLGSDPEEKDIPPQNRILQEVHWH